MPISSRAPAVWITLLLVATPSAVDASYTSTLSDSGKVATMTGDGASDNLTITPFAGVFSHDRFPSDPGFVSVLDFDSAEAGEQVLSRLTGTIHINAGGGDDTIALGNGINLRGAIDGEGGIDTLDYSAFTAAVRANLGFNVPGLNATIGADQEAPPTTHTGTGTATISNINVATLRFDTTVTVSDLPPAHVTGFHIHRGSPGVNGPIIVNFGVLGLVPSGTGFTRSATGVALPATSEAAFLGGGTYVDVHTAALPDGAVRGQLFAAGTATVSPGEATGAASVANVENVVGGAGDDSLTGSFSVNTISGGSGADWIVGGPGGDTLSGGMGDDIVVDGHTSDTDVIEGDADSDTVQVNGDAVAVDAFLVSASGTRIDFDRVTGGSFSLDIGSVESMVVNGIGGDDIFVVNNLTGVASLAALGLHGFNGNDLFSPSQTVGPALSVHGGTGGDTLHYSSYTTPLSVNLGLGTTGLAATLRADMEAPPTTHAGTGTVTVSNYSIATRLFDISITVTDLPPADVNGFHLHRAPIGVNRGIIVDLLPLAPQVPAGTCFTFTATGVSLPGTSEAAFLGGATYVDIHTPAFPAGAIRGQLFSTGNVNLSPTAVATGMASVSGIDHITGGIGADSLVGNFDSNTISGGNGADWIVGGPGEDTLDGGLSTDFLASNSGDGNDVVEGGPASDTVQVNGDATDTDIFTVSPGIPGTRLYLDRVTPGPFRVDMGTVETLIVNSHGGDDSLVVNDLSGVASLTAVSLQGLEGNDSFTYVPASAGARSFTAHGSAGTDVLRGPHMPNTWNLTAGNHGNITGLAAFSFIEFVVGGGDPDTFNVKAFTTGTPTVIGNAGADTLNYNAEARPVSGDTTPPDGVITSPGVQSLTFTEFETVNITDRFTDATLSSGLTTIRAVHVTELRTRINTVRGARGLGAFSFTDPSLSIGAAVIKAVHLLELRTALAEAYTAAGMTLPAYSAPVPAPGVVVFATAMAELRTALLAIE